MEQSLLYNGAMAAKQFLFYEIRIASKLYFNGTTVSTVSKDDWDFYETSWDFKQNPLA